MRGWRGTLFLVAMIGAIGVQLALGVWQWRRMGEKAAYLAAIEAAASADPKPLHRAVLWDRVQVTGQFHPKAVYVHSSRPAPKPGERDSRGRVPISGFGVLVMQAFDYHATGQSGTILVSRGFLPTLPDGKVPPFATPEGEVTITGFLRPGEKEAMFPPYNDPAKGVFFFRDLGQIATAMKLPHMPRAGDASLATTFIDLQAKPDEAAPPFGIEVKDFLKSIPNHHYEYAITWFSLAATGIIILLMIGLSRRKKADQNA